MMNQIGRLGSQFEIGPVWAASGDYNKPVHPEDREEKEIRRYALKLQQSTEALMAIVSSFEHRLMPLMRNDPPTKEAGTPVTSAATEVGAAFKERADQVSGACERLQKMLDRLEI